jgi:hypothetical protein
VPEQKNDYDRGMFVFEFIERFLRNPEIVLGHDNKLG